MMEGDPDPTAKTIYFYQVDRQGSSLDPVLITTSDSLSFISSTIQSSSHVLTLKHSLGGASGLVMASN
jgi:hypothetical protein